MKQEGTPQPQSPLRIFFAGTPECAVPLLQRLAHDFLLCGILTNPPARGGRSHTLQNSPVAEAATALKAAGVLADELPILTPEKLDSAFRAEVSALHPDILVCFAFGKIFGPKMLSLFPQGAINVHPSLLPRWRGCAPIPSAILAGDTETGISIQTISEKMDEGAILLQESFTILPHETSEQLLTRCAHKAASLTAEVLITYKKRLQEALNQNENGVTYSVLLKKEDGLLDWSQSAVALACKIRAFIPWPGTFTFAHGEKITILEAEALTENIPLPAMTNPVVSGTILGTDTRYGILVQTGKGILAVQRLQRPTKKPLSWKEFLNGFPDFLTITLGA